MTSVRETVRDVLLVVAALSGLFASVQSARNGREIAELRGALMATTETVRAHVNTPGLHR